MGDVDLSFVCAVCTGGYGRPLVDVSFTVPITRRVDRQVGKSGRNVPKCCETHCPLVLTSSLIMCR